MAVDVQDEIEQLIALQNERELYINKLSEPIFAQLLQQPQDRARTSDISSNADGADQTTPASLAADLEHYKELFTKLRFSYVEQTTKEKFLRGVVGDPPIHVTAEENARLEMELAVVKATLKGQKTEVADLVADLEKRSRELVQRQENVEAQTEELRGLPGKISELQQRKRKLQEEQAEKEEDEETNIPLPELLAMIEQRRAQAAEMNEKLARQESDIASKKEELDSLRDELGPLRERSANAIATAGVAGRGKGGNGGKSFDSELEEKGRWLRGVQATMTALLEDDA